MNVCLNPLVSVPLASLRPRVKAVLVEFISKNREKVLLNEEEISKDASPSSVQWLDPNKGLKNAFGQFKSLASKGLIEMVNEEINGPGPQYSEEEKRRAKLKKQRYPNEEQIVRDFLRQNPTLFGAFGVREGELDDDDMLLYSRVVYELRREPGMQDAVKTGNLKTIQHIVNAAVDREIDMFCKQQSRPGRPRRFMKCEYDVCPSELIEGGRRRKTKRTYRKRTIRKHK